MTEDQLPQILPSLRVDEPTTELQARAKNAAAIDKGLDHQAALNTFSEKIWKEGLREAVLKADRTHGLTISIGVALIHVMWEDSRDPQADGVLLMVKIDQDYVAFVTKLSDPLGTMYLYDTKAKPELVEEMINLLVTRWPKSLQIIESLLKSNPGL